MIITEKGIKSFTKWRADNLIVPKCKLDGIYFEQLNIKKPEFIVLETNGHNVTLISDKILFNSNLDNKTNKYDNTILARYLRSHFKNYLDFGINYYINDVRLISYDELNHYEYFNDRRNRIGLTSDTNQVDIWWLSGFSDSCAYCYIENDGSEMAVSMSACKCNYMGIRPIIKLTRK